MWHHNAGWVKLILGIVNDGHHLNSMYHDIYLALPNPTAHCKGALWRHPLPFVVQMPFTPRVRIPTL